jgi:choline kinase
MKAVILAAGLCKRIRQVAGGRPKCLLQVGGQTILDYQLESLFEAGVNSVAIVVGYGKEYIASSSAVPTSTSQPFPGESAGRSSRRWTR